MVDGELVNETFIVFDIYFNCGFSLLEMQFQKRIKEELKSIKKIKEKLESIEDKPNFEVITILGKDKEKSTGYCQNYSEAKFMLPPINLLRIGRNIFALMLLCLMSIQ